MEDDGNYCTGIREKHQDFQLEVLSEIEILDFLYKTQAETEHILYTTHYYILYTMHMEPQNTPNRPRNFEKEEQSGKHHTP